MTRPYHRVSPAQWLSPRCCFGIGIVEPLPRIVCRFDGLDRRVPVGGTRASLSFLRDVVAVVALGFLQEAPLEDAAL
jgi:hypothetical protein